MQSEIRMLQGCCGRIWNDSILYPTEEKGGLVQFDFLSGNIKFLEKDLLKNKVVYITVIDESIYLVDTGGMWIAETHFSDRKYVYHELNCNRRKCGNFICIYYYQGKILLFLRDEFQIVEFDVKTKKITRKVIGIPEHICNTSIDCVCACKGEVWFFCGKKKMYMRYSIDKEKIIETHELPIKEKVVYAVSARNRIFFLAQNTVYEIGEKIIPIIEVNTDYPLMRMCFTENQIWLLPGKGKTIFIYSFCDDKCTEYCDYPSDFVYNDRKGGKYIGRCENAESIFWIMRTNNYFMHIDKMSGMCRWIKPINECKDTLIQKCFKEGTVTTERQCTLNDYLQFVCN